MNLIDLASARPAQVRAMTLDPACTTGTAESRVEVLRALAMADMELGDLGRGLAGLEEARQISAGNVRLSALVAVTRAGLLATRGDVTEALRLAERAEPYVSGDDLERLRANRDCALACRGVLTELPPPRSTPADPAVRAGRLIGAGLSHGYAGRFDDAEGALQAAVVLGQRHELPQIVLMALNNLGFVAARRGRLPRALALFGEVEPEMSGERLAQCRLDRAEALITAGLTGEARALLELMMSEAVRAGLTAVAANGLYLTAQAELACGDAARAAENAHRARLAFAVQDRSGWVLKADHLLVRARSAAGDRSPGMVRTAARTADRLDQAGWPEAAARTRIAALAAQPEHAGSLLGQVAVARRKGSTPVRIAAWQATAILKGSRGDSRGALRAVSSGLLTAAESVNGFGSMELRARAADGCADLAALGVRLARTGRDLLTVEEQHRRIQWRTGPALTAGGADVRDRARTVRGPEPSAPLKVGDLVAALGDLGLLELVRAGDELHAVVVSGGRCHHVDLGSYPETVRAVRVLRFAVTQAMLRGEPLRPALDPLAHRFRDVLRRLGERELVIAPVGDLQALPWAALIDRPYTVVPSAAAWMSAQSVRRSDGPVLLVAGPGLAHAEAEIEALSAIYPDAVSVSRPELSGARLAHFAAHGTFRADDPLQSSLALADGPLTAYDLEALCAVPQTVVLSACDAGRGDGPLSLASVLLSIGTRTVIAPVTPVRDADSPAFMQALHRLLASGTPPARALAQLERPPGVLGVQCFGAG